MPALRAALTDRDENYFLLRRAAANALGNLGGAAKPAIPDLIEARRSDDYGLREIAAEALRRIDAADPHRP